MISNFYAVQAIGIVFVFGMPVLIVLVTCLFTYLGKKRKMHLAEVMIQNGKDLPEGYFEKKDSMVSSIKMLRNGLILLAIGIGAALFGWTQNDLDILSLASIPALVGIAYIIVSFVAKKKEKADEQALSAQTSAEPKPIETEPEN